MTGLRFALLAAAVAVTLPAAAPAQDAPPPQHGGWRGRDAAAPQPQAAPQPAPGQAGPHFGDGAQGWQGHGPGGHQVEQMQAPGGDRLPPQGRRPDDARPDAPHGQGGDLRDLGRGWSGADHHDGRGWSGADRDRGPGWTGAGPAPGQERDQGAGWRARDAEHGREGGWTRDGGWRPGAGPGWTDRGGWRTDRRYDWRGWRDRNRALFHAPRYVGPRGYSYRPFAPGYRLQPFLYDRGYWIEDPFLYRLPPAAGPYRWIRYFDDVLLVDLRTGTVMDVIRGFFW